MSYLLSLKGVKVRFRVKGRMFYRRSKKLLRGITLCIEKGKSTALIGDDGCGKRVIAALLLGECKKNAGRMDFKGREVIEIPFSRLSEDFDENTLCICKVPPDAVVQRIGGGTHLLLCNSKSAVLPCDAAFFMKDGKVTSGE